MLGQYLNPLNDVAFKRIFGGEKNNSILTALLNSVLKRHLHRTVAEVTFLPRRQYPKATSQKTSLVELLCHAEEGRAYTVEIQVTPADNFKRQAQDSSVQADINQTEIEVPYHHLEKIIFLTFANYSIFSAKASYKSDYLVLDIVTHEHALDKLAFTLVDLVKFDKQNKKKTEELFLEEKFYYFLRHAPKIAPEELAALSSNAPVLKETFKELDRFYWIEEELSSYEGQEKAAWDNRAPLDHSRKG